MLRSLPTRTYALAASLALGAIFCSAAAAQPRPPFGPQPSPQSSLPATAPTSALPPQTAPLTATTAQPTRAHRAEVRYADGLLSVNANNSSLNSILREISKQTGMKITGGVREERVFGHYGPASPSDILATLLGGTGTNMVLHQTALNEPLELILTPRNGGPTPPNPNAPGFDDGGEGEEETSRPQRPDPPRSYPAPAIVTTTPALTPNPGSVPPSIPQPFNNVNGSSSNASPTAATLPVTNSVPTDSLPTPSVTPPTSGIVDAPNPPATTADPNSPNGVKTPEQIYQQLQQLRQQKEKATTPQ